MATSAGLYRATRAIRFASCCAIRRLARLVTVVSGVRTRGGLAWLVAMAEPSFSAVLVEHVQKAERLVAPFAPAPGPPGRMDGLLARRGRGILAGGGAPG